MRCLSLLVFALLLAPFAFAASDGATIFKNSCVTCHGDAMDGNGPAGQYMNPKPRNLKTEKFKGKETREGITDTVTNGLLVGGNPTSMVGFKGQLSTDDITAVVDFVCKARGSCDKKPGAAGGGKKKKTK